MFVVSAIQSMVFCNSSLRRLRHILKKAEVALFILDKVGFRVKNITREKDSMIHNDKYSVKSLRRHNNLKYL